ncbi:MAG: hypothetical protein HRT38_10665 [Alteromonadaceae bacterium]|nr:hypothetical protein [Alteromonadaceae bacterium]
MQSDLPKNQLVSIQGREQNLLINDLSSLLFEIVEKVQVQPVEDNLSLIRGLGGKLLFLSSFHQFYPNVLPENLIDNLKESIFDQAHNADLDLSLADGITGLGWVLDYLGMNKQIDHNVDIDECLLDLLSTDHWEYDLLYGLVGIGMYAQQRSSKKSGAQICNKVISLLHSLSEKIDDGICWVTNPYSQFIRSDMPSPQVDLGIAHGNFGVLGLLRKMVEGNVLTKTTIGLMQNLTGYLTSQAVAHQGVSVFPSHAGLKTQSLLGWCYGDLANSLQLIKAAKTLCSDPLLQLGLSTALQTTKRNVLNNPVKDAALCHGSSGISLIYMRLYQETGNKEFLNSCYYWSEQTLNMSKSQPNLNGLMPWNKTTQKYLDGRGLLIGYSGIGLSLLSVIHSPATGWDEFLLLS